MGAVGAVGVLAYAVPCHATDLPPAAVSRTAIAGDLRGYYVGERTSAYVLMAFGAASVGAGSVLVTRDTDFARGFGWPLLTLGALETLGAVFYAFQVGAEIRQYEGLLARDPAGFHRQETDHIHGTTARFIAYRLVELGLVIAGGGIATYGFAADRDVWKGAGLGLAAVSLPLLVIDSVNNARAGAYQSQVERFDPALSLQVGNRAVAVSVGGLF